MKISLDQLLRAVHRAGRLVGAPTASYCFDGRFLVPLRGDWSLVVSADDAGRFRLEACRSARVRAIMWCAVGDEARFDALVLAAVREAAVLVS